MIGGVALVVGPFRPNRRRLPEPLDRTDWQSPPREEDSLKSRIPPIAGIDLALTSSSADAGIADMVDMGRRRCCC